MDFGEASVHGSHAFQLAGSIGEARNNENRAVNAKKVKNENNEQKKRVATVKKYVNDWFLTLWF